MSEPHAGLQSRLVTTTQHDRSPVVDHHSAPALHGTCACTVTTGLCHCHRPGLISARHLCTPCTGIDAARAHHVDCPDWDKHLRCTD